MLSQNRPHEFGSFGGLFVIHPSIHLYLLKKFNMTHAVNDIRIGLDKKVI